MSILKYNNCLQGVGSSIVQLKEGKLRTATVQASSLASILRPVVQSGNLLPAFTYTHRHRQGVASS